MTAETEKPRTRLERQRTLTFKEKKDLEELPGRIESLETERDRLYASLADPDFYRQDGNRIPAANARIKQLENRTSQQPMSNGIFWRRSSRHHRTGK